MNVRLLAIGKPKLPFALAGVEEYARRLRATHGSGAGGATRGGARNGAKGGAGSGVSVEFLKAPPSREAQSALLLERSEGLLRVALDERGEQVTSAGLAGKLTAWENRGVKGVALLVGGAEGHTDALRRAADWTWSLSLLTLQHELALLLLCEQLYRAYAIKAGLPYHREG